MNNLSVGKRLYFTFGFVALMLAVSAMLVWKLSSEASHQLDASRQSTVGTAALADAQSAVWAMRWGVAQYLASSDSTVRSKVVGDSAKLRDDFDKAMKTYEMGSLSETERAKLNEVLDALGKYAQARLSFFQLMSDSKIEDATKFRNETLTPAGSATNKSFAELIDLQRRLANERQESAAHSLNVWQGAILLFMAIAVVVAVVSSIVVTHGLLRQLGGEPADAADLARSVATGDLSVPIHLRPGDATSLMAYMKEMQANLTKVVSKVRSNSESVAAVSVQIAQGNQDLSQRTEEQASALEETAASMEELGSTVKQNADNAKQANQLALGASTVAVKGGEVVGQVVETMKGINDASKKIADIIGVIDGIAFQTNILALNAAVEAARAGEQGRGFAVVASEVRSLAGRSAEAAKEIKALIGASVERVEQGTALVDQAGATMTEVVASIRRVTDIMGEISAASSEQSAGVAQVGEAVSQMDKVTQQNAALVEQSAAAAESLKGQAQQLVQVVAVFKLS